MDRVGVDHVRLDRTYCYEGNVVMLRSSESDWEYEMDERALNHCPCKETTLRGPWESRLLGPRNRFVGFHNGVDVDGLGPPFAPSVYVGLEGHDFWCSLKR